MNRLVDIRRFHIKQVWTKNLSDISTFVTTHNKEQYEDCGLAAVASRQQWSRTDYSKTILKLHVNWYGMRSSEKFQNNLEKKKQFKMKTEKSLNVEMM